MDEETTLPPVPDRRSGDARLAALERKLDANTKTTEENAVEITVLRGTVNEIKSGTDALLEMKTAFDKHLEVICTWAKWGKRSGYALLSFAGLALPILVAAKQLGWI